MLVECPQCRQKTKIRDEKAPIGTFLIRCGHCRELLEVCLSVSAVTLFEEEPAKAEAVALDRTADTYDIRKEPVYLKSPENSLVRTVFDRFVADDVTLPVLPDIATRISKLVRNEKTASKDLASAVHLERNIAAKILKLANSAYYRGRDPIEELGAAVTRLGFKTVESTVYAAIASELFRTDFKPLVPVLEVDWDHAVTCAVTASEIAKTVDYAENELAFTAGLLHDIGNVVTAEILSQTPKEKLTAFSMDRDTLVELLADTHVPLGCALLKKWNIPKSLVRATAYHHEPEEVDDMLVDIVSLANAICHKIGRDIKPLTDLPLTSNISAQRLEFNDLMLANMQVQLEDKSREMKAILA